MIKLDYTIEAPQERLKLVNQILEETPEPSEQYLEILGDYLVLCMEKQEKKEKKILTANRLTTINKREISYEGLTEQLESGEDGIYNLRNENSKSTIFQPKITITKADLEEIPLMRELRDSIKFWETKLKSVSGHQAYIIKQTIIELRKDQYVLKNSYRSPIVFRKVLHSTRCPMPIPSAEWVEYNSLHQPSIHYSGCSLCDYRAVSAILQVFPILKSNSRGHFDSDAWALCMDFEPLMREALAAYPIYRRIVEYKMDRLSNAEIQGLLQQEFAFTHSIEYISSLWRNKIPKLIAQLAQEKWLLWYFTYCEKGTWKKCSRCGQIKLAHSHFFSINKTSKNGFYSICKVCRNAKQKEEK